MKLLRLKADGFGMLRGEWHFDPARLNIVIDENERGKTSLLHAIVAALYGLDRDGRRFRGVLTPLERWRPWDGGNYRIELDIESEGETYTIARDFAAGTVQVWNDRAEDVTSEFATDRDDFSVGQPLLGLDADEFSKCSFWQQGELAEVVPEQERDRRASTLQARLESAADTRAGDASAIEAIQALDASLKVFESPELGSTLTIDNALRRLEVLRDTTTVMIRSLEHDYGKATGPLEQVASLDEEERAVRAQLRALEAHGATLRAADSAQRLERDAQRRSEIARLRDETQKLKKYATVAADADTVLSEQAGRHTELAKRLQAANARRGGIEPDLERMNRELVAFADCETCGAEDADALAVRAGELRRIDVEIERAEGELHRLHEVMRAHGLDPSRAIELLPRFDGLSLEQSDLLREQPRIALAQQADATAAEQVRSVAQSMQRDIRVWKQPRYMAGGALAVVGLIAIAAALLAKLPISNALWLAAGSVAAASGIAVVIATYFSCRTARDEAQAKLLEADEQLSQAQLRATENDQLLHSAASELGYEHAQAMLDDWGEAQRLRDLHAPIHTAEHQLGAHERQRSELLAAASQLLARAGGGEATPDALEQAAIRIRQRLTLESERGGVAMRAEHAVAETRELEASLNEAEQAAVKTINAAGLEYQRGSWSAWVNEVSDRVKRSLKLRALIEREIPAIEAELLSDAQRNELRSEVDRATVAVAAAPEAEQAALQSIVSHADVEAHTAELRTRLDALRDARERLRRDVQQVADRYHAEHPGALARLEAIERELLRAQRFRDSVTLARAIERVARDTHRRWAEFLNERVTDLLKDVGSSVSRVRFGEDLDFAVSLAGGHQTARGKAVHQLSSGTRDQLHLSVRLAISEFLSKGGESLPLLIDDCFATSDDDRTRQGMRVLLETFSRHHQIVFVTCHRHRHESLAEIDPTLYAERVHWLELRPVFAGGV